MNEWHTGEKNKKSPRGKSLFLLNSCETGVHDSHSPSLDASSNLKLIPDIDAIFYTDCSPQGLPLVQTFVLACIFSYVSTSYIALILVVLTHNNLYLLESKLDLAL